MTVSIALVYPDLLGTYGDGGNAAVLAQRLRWRGHEADVVSVAAGQPVPESCELYVIGGGEDLPQGLAASKLNAGRPLHRAVDGGAVVLAVCAGLQILGESFVGPDGQANEGLGLLGCVTVATDAPRAIGEVLVEPAPEWAAQGLTGLLTGFENHGSVTQLHPGTSPVGTVKAGVGNQDGTVEGAVSGRVWGTYLHGPVLARNPKLADLLLAWAVGELAPIDDSEPEALHAERRGAAPSSAGSAGPCRTPKPENPAQPVAQVEGNSPGGRPGRPAMTTALFTDRYELTMVEAALRSGRASCPAVFEVFTRALPDRRPWGVFAGLGRLLDALGEFRFGPAELEWLEQSAVVGGKTLEWLGAYHFPGRIDSYREGELYTAGSPVLTVEATFAEAVLLETLVLSILNFDSAVASAASLIAIAAGERPVIEMGSRRVGPGSAVAAARAAYLAGFASTSNLEAGRRYGLPTAGTSSHAFVLAFGPEGEKEAFSAQVSAFGAGTTLLVDTYDVADGIRHAVEVAGPQLGAVRIDSGDLGREAARARALLDELGATGTKLVVTGDLDAHTIAALGAAPVDVYGVGANVVTGMGAPTAGFVYKLVAIGEPGAPAGAPLRAVAKRSVGKRSFGGRKWAWRALLDVAAGPTPEAGVVTNDAGWADIVTTVPLSPHPGARPLQVTAVENGKVAAPAIARRVPELPCRGAGHDRVGPPPAGAPPRLRYRAIPGPVGPGPGPGPSAPSAARRGAKIGRPPAPRGPNRAPTGTPGAKSGAHRRPGGQIGRPPAPRGPIRP